VPLPCDTSNRSPAATEDAAGRSDILMFAMAAAS
jgi:hypothetical protein